MVVKERNRSNGFINLLNFRAKESLFAEHFAELANEPHRLEYFLSVRGVSFFDDTQAQSLNAVWYSLENIDAQTTLILKDVENVEDLLKIKPLLMLKVKNIVFLSKKNKAMKLLRPLVEQVVCLKSIEEAVNWAYHNTEKGDAVLFSAGVKTNMKAEQVRFKNAVRDL